MGHTACQDSSLDSPLNVPPRCSGSSDTPRRRGRVPNSMHVRPAAWYSQERILSIVFLIALFASPATVFAAPPALRSSVYPGTVGVSRRQSASSQNNNSNDDNNSNSSSDGSISMDVWLPILLVTLVFVVFSFVTCVRRCAGNDAATATNRTSANRTAVNTAVRRRPRRTPSQISTKSLPPYMKEPGDLELVLFRGPLDAEDGHELPHAIPALAEEEDEHPEMRNTAFDIALARAESVETMADSSTTNLIRRASELVTKPPELHHATLPHDHRRSTDTHSVGSVGSEVDLLPGHQRMVSADGNMEPRGEAPAYSEAVSAMTTISLNDPEPSNTAAPPGATGGGRSRFSFFKHNPFHSNNSPSTSGHSNGRQTPSSIRSESPGLHVQSGSTLSRFSSHESHESHHSRSPSRTQNLSRSHSRSGSNLFRAFHSQSHPHAGSSTISLDSISAPLTHTLTRAEFRAPKGGLTPEQIKLITSREALEKFGVPYGPDAVAAFSLSRDRLAEMGPPPDFESVTGEHQEPSGSGGVGDAAAQGSDTPEMVAISSRSTSHSPASSDERAESHAGTDVSYATALGSDEEGASELDEPQTARPTTPRTARPSRLS